MAVGVAPEATDCSIAARAFDSAAISSLKVAVDPSSAIASTPALAVPPSSRKTASALWTAPIRVVKCAPVGTPLGLTPVVHSPVNVMLYVAWENTPKPRAPSRPRATRWRGAVGITDGSFDAAALSPLSLAARSWNVWATPFSRPRTV